MRCWLVKEWKFQSAKQPETADSPRLTQKLIAFLQTSFLVGALVVLPAWLAVRAVLFDA
jgi:hypothetical protein